MTSTWAVLADPTRRALLELLRERPRPVNELVERLALSQPATSKHLRVLREAGLVSVRPEAQRRVYEVEARPIAELDAWLAPYRRLWADPLDALERRLDDTASEGGRVMHGNSVTVDGRPAVRFERRLEHPVDAVWRTVTEPDELAHWFPAAVAVDLRAGGTMTFTFPDEDLPATTGVVTELEPPHRFAFTWGGDVLRFELEPLDDGAGCLLRFTHVLEDPDAAARNAAGWHLSLDALDRRLGGATASPPPPEPTAAWQARYDEYVARGLAAGAPIPSGASSDGPDAAHGG